MDISIWEIVLILFNLLFFAFWIWMIVDCVSNLEDKEERATWVVYRVLCGALFAPLYYFQQYRPRKRANANNKAEP